jgi:plastocyanin
VKVLKKIIVLFVVLLLTSQIVSASSLFFAPFNPQVYSNTQVFSITPQVPKIQFIPQFNVNSFGFIELPKPVQRQNVPSKPSPKEIVISQPIVKEMSITTKTILISEEGFKPQTLQVHQGETVQWINKRPLTKSILNGVRALSKMRSPMLEENEIFTWEFNTKGTFVYVDSVVIGRIGKIIVE